MTFRELKENLDSLSDEQLDCDLTVYDPNEQEFYGANLDLSTTEESDVLDKNHPYLAITWK